MMQQIMLPLQTLASPDQSAGQVLVTLFSKQLLANASWETTDNSSSKCLGPCQPLEC